MEEHEVIFSRYLKSLGLKLTNQRKIIMDQIFLTHDHFNVEDLLLKFKQNTIMCLEPLSIGHFRY
jgi:Fe2+ or Zn2+ uptake regulation protein